MPWINYVLASVPLLFPAYLSISFAQIESNSMSSTSSASSNADITLPTVSSQLVAYLAMGIFGFILTDRLVPKIKEYTLRKGICGKDLGKRGTDLADKPVIVIGCKNP